MIHLCDALQTQPNEAVPTLTNISKILAVLCAEKGDEWVQTNGASLYKLVQKGMSTEDANLHDSLMPVFKSLLRVFPPPADDEESQSDLPDFYTFIDSVISEGLRATNLQRGPLLMLQALVEIAPKKIEPFSLSLMKLMARLLRDHIHAPAPSTTVDPHVRFLKLILDICKFSVSFLGDQRKNLLTSMVQLAEKSTNVTLSRWMLEIARDWVLVSKEPYPTLKEKASLLLKMLAYENRGDQLFFEYLTLIYDIYTESSLRRSDITVRLEPAYLVGCRAKDAKLQSQFIELLDLSIPRNLSSRLTYLIGVQSWESLADHNWIHIAVDLLLGCADGDDLLANVRQDGSEDVVRYGRVRDLMSPMRRMLHLDAQTSHELWVSLFRAIWTTLSRKDQTDLTNHLIVLMAREYHAKQRDLRPNVIQSLLEGIHVCSPPMSLPPFLVKYLGKTYNSYHHAMEIIQDSLEHFREEENYRDAAEDSLADLYADLAEDDMFYGLWRRRSLYSDTNIALAFEQHGMWGMAQQHYEQAQIKSRSHIQNYTEQEYCLWEDHFVLSMQKLQQWEILRDLAKHESNSDLLLECQWRLVDWTVEREAIENELNNVVDVPTPRRRFFEAFMVLSKPNAAEKTADFSRQIEDAVTITLQKWISLPTGISAAHIPLLYLFQQYVELQEAAQIYTSLATTTANNLEKKSGDLKVILQAWRERLPCLSDDLDVWSDLVHWRQHVFMAINKAYQPLTAQSTGASAQPNTFGYRGYHETAWIINRYAHQARKHGLFDVCHAALNKIYTLPNIEISEAFLKLREQARCYYQSTNELQAGLEVINNTNLTFFSNGQKAEFFTLKGMFFAKLKSTEEASQAFQQAVQLDMNLAKAWAEWGRFSDDLFKDNPADISQAGNAVSCYMQAAGVYRSAKSRPFLARILWLLSLDDNTGAIAKSFDSYAGELPHWYCITLIPQLLLSLPRREAKQAHQMLLHLARLYPQVKHLKF